MTCKQTSTQEKKMPGARADPCKPNYRQKVVLEFEPQIVETEVLGCPIKEKDLQQEVKNEMCKMFWVVSLDCGIVRPCVGWGRPSGKIQKPRGRPWVEVRGPRSSAVSCSVLQANGPQLWCLSVPAS